MGCYGTLDIGCGKIFCDIEISILGYGILPKQASLVFYIVL